MYYYHENESNSYPPMEIYEDPRVNENDVSDLSNITSGYTFMRGPNVYAYEVAGTTYFVQDAIPILVFSYEEPRVNENDVSDLSNITSGYTFMRGPNVYAYEVSGTTYFVQDAIPIPVFSITGSIQRSYSEDVSHPSSPISSDVVDVENIASSNNVISYPEINEKVETSNGQKSSVKCKKDCHSEKNTKIKRKVKKINVKAKKSVEYKSSVKTEEICNFEAVKKLDGHESYVEYHEFRYLEVNEKLISISEPLQPSYSQGVSHPSSPISSDVLDVENIASSNSVICYTESEEKVEISNGQTCSAKCKEDCHTEKNKRSKRKVKKIKAKAKEIVDYKSSVKTEDIWNLELSEKVKKLDRYKCSFASDESCNLEVNEKITCTPEICTAKEKNSKENKNDVIYGQVSNLYANEKDEKTDYSKNSVKGSNECILEENKRNKRKVKKRKAKERKIVENENAVKSNQSWNSESIKKFQQKEENKMAVKSNELCNLEGNVKNENSLKDELCVKSSEDLTLETNTKKQKMRKRKKKIEETVEIKSFAIYNEVSNTDFNEKDLTFDESKISLNSHEHCNLEASKTAKRKSNVKISIEHECSIKGNAASIQNKNLEKSNEVCKINVNKKIQISEECKMSIKSQETSNLEANKTSKKKRKKRKRKGKKILEHQCFVENEASSAKLKENLTKSDIHNVCLKSDEVCAFEVKEEIKKVKEHKLCIKSPDVSDSELNKKMIKIKNKNVKDEISVENKSVCFHEHINLESIDHVYSNEGNILCTTITDMLSTINDESSIVEKIDSNKTFYSSCETKNVSTYISEYDIPKNVEEEGETNICTRPSSVQILHSNGNDLFDMSDQKLHRVNEKDNLEHVDEYLVSTSKMDGGSNKQSNVQFQECNSPSDVHVTRTDLSYKDSPSSSPTSKAVKKKRFQRIRKWFNGLFSCFRKNKD